MGKLLTGIIVFFLLCSSAFLYTPSESLQIKLDEVAQNLQDIVDERGESFRLRFIETIHKYQELHKGNEEIEFILSYLLESIQSSEVVHPNILLIIADDMGLDATPWYEEWSVKPNMPHLKDMITEGVIYENLWSAPTCTPTRATILTGKYGYHTDMLQVDDQLSTEEMSLQSYLNQHTNKAYNHAVVGKWHVGNDPDHPSEMWVDYYAGLLSWGVPSYWSWKLTQDGSSKRITEYSTTKITDLASDWVTDNSDEPWFLWVAYNAPHTPFHLPPSNLHSNDTLLDDESEIEANPEPYYMAMLEALDTEIGRLLDDIWDEELAETVVIFIGDNGTPWQVVQFPYERRKAKGSLYQGGINVPMIVSGYWVTREWAREEALINTTDLFATIADIANTGMTSMHNSQSFKESFQSDFIGREYVYGEVEDERNGGYTIRNDQYKLIRFSDGTEAMYDLNWDPYEDINLLEWWLWDDEAAAKNDLENYANEIRK